MAESTSERVEERLEQQAERDPSADPSAAPQRVPVNVYTTDSAAVVVAPLPGVMPDDVAIEIDGNRLTLKAEMRSSAPKDYVVHEWSYGPYERTVELPEGFGGEATASFGNGQLAVSVKKGSGGSGRVTVGS